MVNKFKDLMFRLKWTFLSPEARYAYLWNRTRANMETAYERVRY